MAGWLETLLTQIRGCRVFEAHPPHGLRPIWTASRSARLLVIGQAPGATVHDGGIPWDDRSVWIFRGIQRQPSQIGAF